MNVNKIEQIQRKNDLLRKTFDPIYGEVVITRSVLNSSKMQKIIESVKKFDNFNSDNDPYGEHDCAVFEVDGVRCLFKIDYYDENYQNFEEDGHRVLTIMQWDEY